MDMSFWIFMWKYEHACSWTTFLNVWLCSVLYFLSTTSVIVTGIKLDIIIIFLMDFLGFLFKIKELAYELSQFKIFSTLNFFNNFDEKKIFWIHSENPMYW